MGPEGPGPLPLLPWGAPPPLQAWALIQVESARIAGISSHEHMNPVRVCQSGDFCGNWWQSVSLSSPKPGSRLVRGYHVTSQGELALLPPRQAIKEENRAGRGG